MVTGVAAYRVPALERQIRSDCGRFRRVWAQGACLCPNASEVQSAATFLDRSDELDLGEDRVECEVRAGAAIIPQYNSDGLRATVDPKLGKHPLDMRCDGLWRDEQLTSDLILAE